MSKTELVGGRLKNFVRYWHSLTSDKFVISNIEGVEIDFINEIQQSKPRQPISCSDGEKTIMDVEIAKYIRTGIIEEVDHSEGEFISQIFPRIKKSGGVRIILNLKSLNENVHYQHFKMENLQLALGLIEENYFMASVDLKDAYYSVSIAPEYRKFLRFIWNGRLYQYTCLPNGLTSAPRIFTKIMKPVFSKLRNEGFFSVYYLDDSLLIGSNETDCKNNVHATTKLLTDAGFIINYDKSSFEPSCTINFLGFVINSNSMTIYLPEEKKIAIIEMTKQLLNNTSNKIRFVAKFIGTLVSSLPAVQYGNLYYRFLEQDKISALAFNKGNFDCNMSLSDDSVNEVLWWRKNIMNSFKYIKESPPTEIITTDASKKGWGAVYNGLSTGGLWTNDEASLHINLLELKAIQFGLCSYLDKMHDEHIRIRTDNTTSVSYVNNLGGVKSIECHKIVKRIWEWAIERNNFLSAVHLPGSENLLADKASRIFDENTEWEIDDNIFDYVCETYGKFDVDLFASRINNKLEPYVAWKPDPRAIFIDAFSEPWHKFTNFYAFPPFSVVMKCLKKIAMEKAKGILIVPLWPTQSWFPKLIKMLVQTPLVLPKNVMHLPFKKEATHKQHKNLRLLVCPLSGNSSEAEVFRMNPLISSVPLGEILPSINMRSILKNGIISVTNRKLIPCNIMK